MTAPPRVSVVIPAYNRAATLDRCLDSVLRQTRPPDEVLVVDDCSTDDTSAVVRGRGDSRVRLLRQAQNQGAQAARNRGIEAATGDWIAFQDSDDWWYPNKLERQVAALCAAGWDPYTVVHGDCDRFDVATGETTPWILPEVSGADVRGRLLAAPAPVFPALLTSKLALEEIGLLDVAVPSYQEWDTAIRLAARCRFVHLRGPLFVYVLHAGETISKDRARELHGYRYIVSKHAADIRDRCGQTMLDAHWRRIARFALAADDRVAAREALSAHRGRGLAYRRLQLVATLSFATHTALGRRIMRGL
jgi:glycosyltransferase involved in cell wall biosynthesis